jgi:hypothetical protein
MPRPMPLVEPVTSAVFPVNAAMTASPCECLEGGFPMAAGALQEDMARLFPGPPIGRRAVTIGLLAAAVAALGAARARAQDAVPSFEITAVDIAQIRDLGGRLHIALRAPARARFARFTAHHKERLARVTAGAVVLSGLLSSDPLDDATRGRALRLLTGG